MNVGQICSRNLVRAPASAPLSEIATLMHDRHVGAVVVTMSPLDQPVASGVITDRDLVRAQLERTVDFPRLRAADIMARNPLVFSETDCIADVIQRMHVRGVRRAPVVTTHGALAGLVSTDDLITQLARELASLARVLERQPKHEHEHL
jgi:CBS domain-containing protein